VTWGTPVQSFVFLGLLVFELEPMYATSDRRTDNGRRSPLNAPAPPSGRGHNNYLLWLLMHIKFVYIVQKALIFSFIYLYFIGFNSF